MSIWNFLSDFDNSYQGREITSVRKMSAVTRKTMSRRYVKNKDKFKNIDDRLEELENEVGQVTLYLMGAIEMLKKTENWDIDKFKQVLIEIDGKDGVEDGKASL